MSLGNRISKDELIEDDPMREHFVWWDDITHGDIEGLRGALDAAVREQDVQSYLEQNPLLLIQHLGGGHGRWVIPQKRLGAEHVTDFVIGDRDSMGRSWIAVELESPKARLFTSAGNPTRSLSHAERQIFDWRSWLVENQNYAARPREKKGLGLEDIDPALPGLILIGRRKDMPRETSALRRQMGKDSNIEIHTYDWLIDRAEGRVSALQRHPNMKAYKELLAERRKRAHTGR
jgi:hypothetical protein